MSAVALVAPDSFKGTLSGAAVAAAIARGLRAAGAEAVECPVADGGEGTMEVLLGALGGELAQVAVTDPLGRPIDAALALLADGRAIVEIARASGLGLVAEEERDAWAASSRGTGELIAAALRAGASEVLVAAGGSATSDGGAGALEALAEADAPPARMTVLCDVLTPFERAAEVFGPQKGADPATVARLTRRLERQAAAAPRDPRRIPMTGAAGGLAGALWAHLGAELVAGAPHVLDAIGFDGAMRAATFVVTGEGSLDEQTLAGKVVGEVATRCRQAGVSCHAIVGRDRLDPFRARILDLASVREAGTIFGLEAAGRALAL